MVEIVLAVALNASALTPAQLARPVNGGPGFGIGDAKQDGLSSMMIGTKSFVGQVYSIDDWQQSG